MARHLVLAIGCVFAALGCSGTEGDATPRPGAGPPRGPRGFLGSGCRARRGPRLRAAVVAGPETQWETYPYGKPEAEATRECAEVTFVPNEHSEHKDTQPLRYIAIRIRPRQGELLNDGTQVKHFAVVTTTRDWKPARLLRWRRE